MNEWIIYRIEHISHSLTMWLHSQLLEVKSESVSHSVVSSALWPHGLQPARLLCPWDSPGKSAGVGCHALSQGIFPTQGLNPGLPHCRWILYHLSHQGSPDSSLSDTKFVYVHSCFPFWIVGVYGQLTSIIQHGMFHRHQKLRLHDYKLIGIDCLTHLTIRQPPWWHKHNIYSC